jgi:hypothetical protein
VTERDEVRRAREKVEELEADRLQLSGDVMRGGRKVVAEDRQLERRIRDLTRWIMRAEQGGRRVACRDGASGRGTLEGLAQAPPTGGARSGPGLIGAPR